MATISHLEEKAASQSLIQRQTDGLQSIIETVGRLSKSRDGKKILQKLVEQKSIVRKLVRSQKLGIIE